MKSILVVISRSAELISFTHEFAVAGENMIYMVYITHFTTIELVQTWGKERVG